MLDERKEAANFVDNFLKRERQVDESLAKVKQLRKHWEDKITAAEQEADRIKREAVGTRKITFATPTEQQPFATPKDNMKKAAEILKKKDEEIDIDYVRTLVASAMKQQSKADTSRRLESNPDHCMSTAQKDAHDNHHRDDESRTGSSERRRKAREHPNPIPVPSKTPPSDPRKGKDAMYAGKDKYRNPSPPPNGYPRPPPPRRRSPAGNTRPHGPGGINIRDNVPPPRNRKRERTPEPRRSRINDHEPEPRRSRNGEREPEPRRSRNDEGSQHQGPARILLSDLEKNSIFCWFDLKNAFEKHFRGTYKRPSTTSDLQACIQKKGETSRNFLTRWLATRNECENVDHTTAMHTFIGGLQRGGLLRHKLTCLANANKLTLDDMISIADHIAIDDDAGGDLAATAIPLHQKKKNRDNGNSSGSKRKNPPDDQKSGGSDMVAMAFQRGGYKRARKHRPRGKGGKGKNKDKEEDSSEAMDEDDASPDPKEGSAAKPNPFGKKSVGAYHTFLGTPTDHPAIILKEYYALVVSPLIDGYDFSKCLMDGGASLNIMYLETLERMNLTKEQLKHSTTEFHGVVPEMITFEVVPFKSSYHVIFGRPAYHKFHARACYIYNKLKIPGPNGMITVSGDYQKDQECEIGEATFAESVISEEELRGYRAAVDPIEMQTTKKQISEQKNMFNAAIETKKIDLKKGDSTKQIRMKKSDQKVTSFITPFGTYCYVTMPFGLKNAAISRFVSRLGEKALPLYKLLKKTDNFVWDEAADAALKGLKEILTSPPILAAPEESEPMLLYLAATNRVISLVIVVERKEEGHELDKLLMQIWSRKLKRVMHSMDPSKDQDGTWNARNSVMVAYRDEVDEIAKCFLGYEVKYVQRDYNTAADMLSKLGSQQKPIRLGIFLEHLRIPSGRALTRKTRIWHFRLGK
ncbi:hypothetical protein QYE76_060808 [Lolium multiflorum]|uniref:Retrotransposon gag domain-containing protein n=1 Tax=Lolium multiflorum TaxID=4521 RepID=A0AAD8S154_LOLMU|nr:hypothetical protein QYE76_060808 [Lolium multiflorum]